MTMWFVKPSVRDLAAYHLTPQPCRIKVNQNENPFDLPDDVKREILDAFAKEAWCRYPPFVPEALHGALAAHYGVPDDWVLAGNGSNEVLYATLAVTLGPQDHAVVPVPTFALYALLSTVMGATPHPIDPRPSLAPDVEAIVRKATDTRAKVIFLCSPCNPTGYLMSESELTAIVTGVSGLVILDEAYVEFAHASLTQLVRRYENLVVLRTFSKALGLASLRIGCLIGRPDLVREIAKGKLPYNISTFTGLACQIALRRIDRIRPSVDRIKIERERLAHALGGGAIPGITVSPSEANFLLVRIGPHCQTVFEALLRAGILVRDVSRYPHLSGHLRVSVGTPQENDAVIEAFTTTMAQSGSPR